MFGNLVSFVGLFGLIFCFACVLLYPREAMVANQDLDLFYEKIAGDAILSEKFDFIMENMGENYAEAIVALGADLGYKFSTQQLKDSISQQGSYVCLPLGCWSFN